MTAEEFFLHGPDQPCELIEGELHTMAPPGWEHGRIAGNIHALLWNHARARHLGAVGASETGFLVKRDRDTVLAPDVSFVRVERLPQGRHPGYLPFAPDLAVEVVSPSQSLYEVDEKTELWLKSGAAMVWVVWPNTRSVSVHRPDRPVTHLHEGDRIDGEDVVPGFVCAVSEVFQ
jgi:Uma2 family endonuclease